MKQYRTTISLGLKASTNDVIKVQLVKGTVKGSAGESLTSATVALVADPYSEAFTVNGNYTALITADSGAN